jgi:serpin B
VAADTRFGLALFQQMARSTPATNLFLSPYSIAVALQMTWNGADGETRAAMARALALGALNPEQVNAANAGLREALRPTHPKVELAVANSLWAANGVPFKQEFLQRNQQFYGAELRNLVFTDPDACSRINGWVNEATRGRIPFLVQPGDLTPDLILILLNAVYFKGEWKDRFDRAQTREGQFTLADGERKAVPMMSRSGDFSYLQERHFQAVSLPYAGDELSMLLFLPEAGSSPATFAASLTPEKWERWTARFSTSRGELAMPRFKLEYEAELKPPLSELGMGIAFTDRADFSALCDRIRGPVYLDKVRHKTFLEVNEEGTEAAAATSVHVVARGRSASPFRMVLDRPFCCAIHDNRTGALLFLGAIFDPSGD